MHFSVIREHRDFFKKHHWMEFDGVLSSGECQSLSEEIQAAITDRQKQMKNGDRSAFALGHDLWRHTPALKKAVLNRRLARIASELIEVKTLRIGYDQAFPSAEKLDRLELYASFLKTTPTLEEMTCIQGVICGAMICVSGNSQVDPDQPTTLFSQVSGNIVFFSPKWPMPLQEVIQYPQSSHLLIVYVQHQAVYLANEGDPHLYHFKDLGYQYGDRLKESLHPIVYEPSFL